MPYMNITISQFIQMIRVLDFADNIYDDAIRFIQRENKDKDQVRDLIKQYFNVKRICNNDLNEFTDEMCEDAEVLFSFIFISLVFHLENDLSNWRKFKTRLQGVITNEMEEIQTTINEYTYVTKYNQFRDAIHLLEIFILNYPNIIDYEITTNARIYLNTRLQNSIRAN